MDRNPTAAILVIGDEILSGRTRDSNLHFLAGELSRVGIDLREARVVPDRRATIVEAVRALAEREDLDLSRCTAYSDSANDLLGVTLDPNVAIQESKVSSVDIRPGRRPRGPQLLHLVQDYQSRSGITVETGTGSIDITD